MKEWEFMASVSGVVMAEDEEDARAEIMHNLGPLNHVDIEDLQCLDDEDDEKDENDDDNEES